ncbi:MAG: RICIN domain-containing protein, partial [Clostridia bacterium]|nr:RICIN domain-containing protein [Clostridia bacterium]
DISEDLKNNIEENNNKSCIITNGIYQIRTMLDSNKVLDVTGGSLDNGANVEIWNDLNGDNQKFQFTYDNEGYYTISDIRTGKVLDIYGGYTIPGTNVQMWEANGTDGQKWKIEKDEEGYSIISKSSNLYLDVYRGDTTPGTNVQIWENNGTVGQKWKIEQCNKKEEKVLEDGIYQIKMKLDSNKVIDVKGASLNNGANVEIWNNLNGNNQKFQFIYDNEGYYTISDIRTGKALDVYGGYTKPGTNVQMWEANGTDGQKWKIEKNGEEYSIISKIGDLCLDVYGGYTSAGTNVQVWTNNNMNSQKFLITKNKEITIENGIYMITTKLDSNKVLDVTGGSLDNGANVEIWNKTELNNQKFLFTCDNEGYYTISDTRTGKVLDVYGGYTEPGTNVQMWEANGPDGQKGKIEKEGEEYSIVSKASNLYLDVYGGYSTAGTNIQIWTKNESYGQKFIFEKTTKNVLENGIYEIQTIIDKNKVLDVTGESIENGANVEIWERTNGNNQKFNITYIGGECYTISDVRTGKMLDVYEEGTEPGTNVQMWEANGKDGQKWKIEKNEEGYSIISKVSNLCLDVYGGYAVAGTNVQIWTNNGSNSQRFIFNVTTVKEENQSNFQGIDTSKYPGYKELIEQLQSKHLNWTIKLHYTGLDWNDVLNHEDNVDWQGIPYSLTDYTGNWRSSDPKNYGAGFYRASREAIAYMMDPRNSLDQYYVFQFQELASSSGTYDQIQKMISGSYLEKYNVTNVILQVSRDYNVSPFHLVSRMKQEQGSNGWSVNGYSYNNRTVYNFCNIGATGNTDSEIILSGAQYAYDNHWYTPEMCINGSAKFLHDNYFNKGQSTLYFQKYNVITSSPYTNQYMQNIRAANDEGYRIAKSYENNGLLNSSFTFTIPVYENMPSSACSRPSR